VIDTYEKDLAQARSFMETLRNLAKGKIPETPQTPETKETLRICQQAIRPERLRDSNLSTNHLIEA
jgi:hypothetical protein